MADDNDNKRDDQGSDLTKAIEALLGKHNNDTSKAINQLLSENYRLRDDKRVLKDRAEGAEGKLKEAEKKIGEIEKSLPAEGAMVLSKADAVRWEAYQALGKPDEVKEALAERDNLKAEVSTAKREQLLREVSEIEGWNLAVLKRLAPAELEFEVSEQKDEKTGEKRRVASVLTKSENGRVSTMGAGVYAEEEWQEFLPSLKVNGTGNSVTYSSAQPKSIQIVKQPGAATQAVSKEQIVKHERDNLLATGSYSM